MTPDEINDLINQRTNQIINFLLDNPLFVTSTSAAIDAIACLSVAVTITAAVTEPTPDDEQMNRTLQRCRDVLDEERELAQSRN